MLRNDIGPMERATVSGGSRIKPAAFRFNGVAKSAGCRFRAAFDGAVTALTSAQSAAVGLPVTGESPGLRSRRRGVGGQL
jgi:hypothetical protein